MRSIRKIILKKCIYSISPFITLLFFTFSLQDNWEKRGHDKVSQKEILEKPIEPKESSYSIVNPDSILFTAQGLANEGLLMNLFKGDFVNIPIDRDAQLFALLYSSYLNSYARKCGVFLPANKVEMTRQECATEEGATDGFGMEVSRNCVRWVTVGTGLYAKPELYNGKLALEKIQSADAFRNIFGMINQNNGLEGMMDKVGDAQAIVQDVNELMVLNECNSAGLMRFEENLKLFALNKQPVRLTALSTQQPTISSANSAVFKDQDYQRLINDLISDHSQGWVMNIYEKGSVSNTSVTSRDESGRPAKIIANYIFSGFSGRSKGAVTLTFTNGLPECMYFFDFPSTCRTPNRRIVAAYDNYSYAQ